MDEEQRIRDAAANNGEPISHFIRRSVLNELAMRRLLSSSKSGEEQQEE